MLNYTNFYMLMVYVMTPYKWICHKIEGIEGNRPQSQNLATIALAKFLPTSSQVRSSFARLSCSRSGRSERLPSMTDDWTFSKYCFAFSAPTVLIPLFKLTRHRHIDSQNSELIFIYIDCSSMS